MTCPKVGDRVRFAAWGKIGPTKGTVVRVKAMKRPIGGSCHRVRVRWETGVVGTYDDRTLEVIT